MIRRTALVALAATLVMAGAAFAASPSTLRCVKNEAIRLRACQLGCRDLFKSGRASCYGPGAGCAGACTTQNDNCQKPITDPEDGALTLCNRGCQDTLALAIQQCRSANPTNPDAADACANAARLVALQCRLDCRDQYDNALFACSQQLGECLGSCASCASPLACPSGN